MLEFFVLYVSGEWGGRISGLEAEDSTEIKNTSNE